MNDNQAHHIASLATLAFDDCQFEQCRWHWQGQNQLCYLAGVLEMNDPNWQHQDVVIQLIKLGLNESEIGLLQRMNDEEGLNWRQINIQVLRMAKNEDTRVYRIGEAD